MTENIKVQPAIFFGTPEMLAVWIEQHNMGHRRIYLATQPERIQGLIGPFEIIRNEGVWTPANEDEAQRVWATEDWIKQDELYRKISEIEKDYPPDVPKGVTLYSQMIDPFYLDFLDAIKEKIRKHEGADISFSLQDGPNGFQLIWWKDKG